jgi:MOSC domain-containing protein YiiM
MLLVSANIGRLRRELLSGRELETAIVRQPVEGPVVVGPLGLEGDEVADRENHGGPDQALYLYTAEDYAWWSAQLGHDLAPGTFGENLTVAGFESAALAVGDRLRIGDALLEVTAPRIPCATFAARMGDPQWVKCFARADRPGRLSTRALRGDGLSPRRGHARARRGSHRAPARARTPFLRPLRSGGRSRARPPCFRGRSRTGRSRRAARSSVSLSATRTGAPAGC